MEDTTKSCVWKLIGFPSSHQRKRWINKRLCEDRKKILKRRRRISWVKRAGVSKKEKRYRNREIKNKKRVEKNGILLPIYIYIYIYIVKPPSQNIPMPFFKVRGGHK